MALGLLLTIAGVLLLYAGRHLTFFFDEWTFVTTRRGGGISAYLDPHNGHVSLFPVVVYKALLTVFGLRHYTPYRAVGIALHLLCATLLYVLARPRLGAWPALVPTAMLLFMGTAFQVLLWPFQIGYLQSLAGGLAALVLIDRDGRPRDALITALLTWSVFSGGVGLAFLVACGVALIARGSPWRRLWTVAVPAVLFGLWYLGWASGDSTSSDALLGTPQYVADAYAGAVAGIAGLEASWAPSLAIAFLATLAVAWRSGQRGRPTPILLAAAAGVLTFWILAAVVRSAGPEPAASRYLYVGAVFLWLIAAEAAAGISFHGLWAAGVGVLLAGALIANIGVLRSGERSLRTNDAYVRASLRIVELAAPVVSPGYAPEPARAPQLTAGTYLAAVRDLGSPALTLTELERAPAAIRVASDGVLEQAEHLTSTPANTAVIGTRSVSATAVSGGRVITHGLCQRLEPSGGSAAANVAVPTGSKLLVAARGRSVTSVYLRRFSSGFVLPPFAQIESGRQALISFPVDRAPGVPWQARISSSGVADVCLS